MNNRELPGMIPGSFYIRRKLEDRPCEGAYLGLSVLRQEKTGDGTGNVPDVADPGARRQNLIRTRLSLFWMGKRPRNT